MNAQARTPAGSPVGGQFAGNGGGAEGSIDLEQTPTLHTPTTLAELRRVLKSVASDRSNPRHIVTVTGRATERMKLADRLEVRGMAGHGLTVEVARGSGFSPLRLVSGRAEFDLASDLGNSLTVASGAHADVEAHPHAKVSIEAEAGSRLWIFAAAGSRVRISGSADAEVVVTGDGAADVHDLRRPTPREVATP